MKNSSWGLLSSCAGLIFNFRLGLLMAYFELNLGYQGLQIIHVLSQLFAGK